jgi:hypothetical protein
MIIRSTCHSGSGRFIQVFPNPSSGLISLNGLEFNEHKNIVVINSSGQQVQPKLLKEDSGSVDYAFDGLANGIYSILITDSLGKVHTFKFSLLKQY